MLFTTREWAAWPAGISKAAARVLCEPLFFFTVFAPVWIMVRAGCPSSSTYAANDYDGRLRPQLLLLVARAFNTLKTPRTCRPPKQAYGVCMLATSQQQEGDKPHTMC